MSETRIPLVDIERQHRALQRELTSAFERVLHSSRFILGEEVEGLESELASYLGVPHAIGVSSGTDALVVALLALGVRPGDEVITTPFSFFATVGSILRIGAVPRFADIEPAGFNLDAGAVSRAITSRTRAVLCVHLFGQPANLVALREICDARGIALVEDGAQALSAEVAGRRVGAWGDASCFSFFPSKPLGGFGDGGLVAVRDPELAKRCRLLRAHGSPSPHHHVLLGGNHRLDALQAALLRVKLPHLDAWQAARAEHAAAYDAALAGCAGLLGGCVGTLHTSPQKSAHAHYTLRLAPAHVERRSEILAAMDRAGIQTAVYYRRPLYSQGVPELRLSLKGDEARCCPNVEARCREVITLPIFPELSVAERTRVCDSLLEQLG